MIEIYGQGARVASAPGDVAAPAREALPADPVALLAAVLAENEGTRDPRLRRLFGALITHLHAFARETELSLAELEVATDFLVRIGKATGPEKNEGILLADILGLATLVGLNDAKNALKRGGTEPALIGPFWRANQPIRPNGSPIASPETPGDKLHVQARVMSLDGTPIPGARIETWQASPGGLYENQDPTQEDFNLRARFESDQDGRFSFYSVRPAGSAAASVRRTARRSAPHIRPVMRPAHLHFLVFAPGHKTLATQIFDADDPNAYRDAVFGAVGSLLHTFTPEADGSHHLDLELKLEPGEMRMPVCPLP
jgi:catechol 1,2-dioxygenase